MSKPIDLEKDLTKMKFDQLREEAEALLSKYQDSKDEGEMRAISNRFCEVDTYIEEHPKGDSEVEAETAPEPIVERAAPSMSLLQSISFTDVTSNPENIPAPKMSEFKIEMSVPKKEIHTQVEVQSSSPEPDAQKITSGLDSLPLPELEQPTSARDDSENTVPPKQGNSSAMRLGDLGAALASVKELVQDYAPVRNEPAEKIQPQKAPNFSLQDDAGSTETAEATIMELLDEFTTSDNVHHEVSELSAPDEENVVAEKSTEVDEWDCDIPDAVVFEAKETNDDFLDIHVVDVEDEPPSTQETRMTSMPLPEVLSDSKISEVETPTKETPKPVAPVEDKIPSSINESLPKFELSERMRICHQCGHETRLAREECQKCEYVDQSLGILDAVIAGNLEKVQQILLVKPLVVMTRTSHHGWTMLHMAASGGNTRMVQLLIERGATVNAQNTFGKTSLHYAASKGHKEIVEKLLEHHADTEMLFEGKTSAELATENGHAEIAELLGRI